MTKPFDEYFEEKMEDPEIRMEYEACKQETDGMMELGSRGMGIDNASIPQEIAEQYTARPGEKS